MAQAVTLPTSTQVKFFIVYNDFNQPETVKTQAFSLRATKAPANSMFVVLYKLGIGGPVTEFQVSEELWQYFGEVGATLTLNCTFEHDPTFGVRLTGCVVGDRLYPLV